MNSFIPNSKINSEGIENNLNDINDINDTQPQSQIPIPILKHNSAFIPKDELDNSTRLIRFEKYNYILDWFAYLIQRPRSKNRIILAVQDTEDKLFQHNFISFICEYLKDNLITDMTSSKIYNDYFHGQILYKRLIIFSDIYTDAELDILKRFHNSLTCSDKFTIILIVNNDFIKLRTKYENKFCLLDCTNENFKTEFFEELLDIKLNDSRINQFKKISSVLINRNLNKYNAKIYRSFEQLVIKRSPVYYIAINEMKKRNNSPIVLSDFVDFINKIKKGEIDEYKEYIKDLRKIYVTIRTIRKFLDFRSSDNYIIKQYNKRGIYRNCLMILYHED